MPNPPIDAPIPLQQDTISNVPGIGSGVRTIIAVVPVNGAPTPVAIQVVALTDADGRVLDFAQANYYQLAMLQELRMLNQLLSTMLGVPYLLPTDTVTQAIG